VKADGTDGIGVHAPNMTTAFSMTFEPASYQPKPFHHELGIHDFAARRWRNVRECMRTACSQQQTNRVSDSA
jgi:hypothetical protein